MNNNNFGNPQFPNGNGLPTTFFNPLAPEFNNPNNNFNPQNPYNPQYPYNQNNPYNPYMNPNMNNNNNPFNNQNMNQNADLEREALNKKISEEI